MWVLLGNANIHDAKARKVCTGLSDSGYSSNVVLNAPDCLQDYACNRAVTGDYA